MKISGSPSFVPQLPELTRDAVAPSLPQPIRDVVYGGVLGFKIGCYYGNADAGVPGAIAGAATGAIVGTSLGVALGIYHGVTALLRR